MNKPSAKSRTLRLPMRMSRAANTVIAPGSFELLCENQTEPDSNHGVRSMQSQASSPRQSSPKLSADNDVALQLGESARPRKIRTFTWAIKQLHRGFLIARHGFALESTPKRLQFHLRGFHGVQVLYCIHENECEAFASFTYADIMARDWYVVEQLELAK